jgi:hypothetical protein
MKIIYSTAQFQEQDAAFFCEMLPYVSPHIERTIKRKNSVEIKCEEAFEAEIQDKINHLENLISTGRLSGEEVTIKTLEAHTEVEPLNTNPIFEPLRETGSVKEVCPGVYAYCGIFLKVFRYFCRKIDAFGCESFPDITEYELPVLYPIEEFEKGKYFETFPHYIMFQTLMKNDIDVLDRFAKHGTRDKSLFREMREPANVLKSAACVPVYAFLRDRRIPADTPISFLVSGKCFRNEADNVFELARLNEFYMKEYVFVGAPEHCAANIEKAKDLWKFWADIFGFNCKVDTANDSFFASNYKKLKYFQMLGDSKQELKCLLPASDMYIACSSANVHRTHFTKPYRIRSTEESYCYSSCFAFGIERLTYALLAQKGIEPAQWDTRTFNEVAKYSTI